MTDTVIVHPNRDKAESHATRAAVILLLLTGAGLTAIITIGGWSRLAGAQVVAIAIVLIYLVMAYYVGRWNRGVLPVAAALGVLMGILAAVAAPGWFDRDKTGFENPAIEPSVLGLLTLLIVPVCLLLIAFAMRGFQQKWNVEVEVAREEAERGRPRDFEGGEAPAG
jgi:protein-S-isoprenylcysteine O-methyltransferase Ste14